MFQIPVTYFFAFGHAGDELRRYIFHEFAVNGAKHLVLASDLIQMIFQNYKMADQLRQEAAAEGLTFMDAHSAFGGILDLNCPDPDFRLNLSGLDSDAFYEVGFFSGEKQKLSGRELASLTIHLEQSRSFQIIRYERVK